jgi:Flp pilus assembly protein TadG
MNSKRQSFRISTSRTAERGQSSVEFALMAIFILLLIVGFIEMVLFLHTYSVLADSAKEGIRYAIVHGADNTSASGPTCPCSAIDGAPGTGVVKTYAKYSLHDTSKMTVTVDYNPNSANGAKACNVALCMVRVTVSYLYQPFFGLGWPKNVTVNAAADGRIVY